MKKYTNIVLNIPHSSTLGIDESGWNNKSDLKKTSIKKWTDWHTEKIFNPIQNLVPYINKCVFNKSRFIVDVERLIDDPLETIGEGILYTSKDGFIRTINEVEKAELMQFYYTYINSIKECINENTLLIDCHSFPSELSDVHICIGFNNDESYDAELIKMTKEHFELYGYKVGINEPYSNSLYPTIGYPYSSMMIEVNKKLYMNEETTELLSNYYKIGIAINSLYEKILGLK